LVNKASECIGGAAQTFLEWAKSTGHAIDYVIFETTISNLKELAMTLM